MKKSILFIPIIAFFACEQGRNETPVTPKTVATTPKDTTLVFSDEFDGNTLDASNWTFQTGQHGWGNNELQNYTASGNVEVSNGTLKIIAKKTGTGQQAGDYSSARLNSVKSFKQGRMEVRAKLPPNNGNGLWPAIWMLGNDISTTNWPDCGEIDIMEYVSYEPHNVHCTLHSKANNWTNNNQLASGAIYLGTAESEFHKYGVLWTDNAVKFYIDTTSNVVYSVNKPAVPTSDNWPFNKPFFFLLNMAVGGNWGGLYGVNDAVFPAKFEIDYVRVYKR